MIQVKQQIGDLMKTEEPLGANLHLDIDNFEPQPMQCHPDKSFSLSRMLPPSQNIRYFFSLCFNDPERREKDEKMIVKKMKAEVARIIPD
jgi:hypothetical protein